MDTTINIEASISFKASAPKVRPKFAVQAADCDVVDRAEAERTHSLRKRRFRRTVGYKVVHFSRKLPSSISIKRINSSPEWRFCGCLSGVMPQFGFRINSVLHQVVDFPFGLGCPFSFSSGSLKQTNNHIMPLRMANWPASDANRLDNLIQAPW
jgi:hypothetical protein